MPVRLVLGVKIRGFYARSIECKGEGIEPAGPNISLCFTDGTPFEKEFF